MNEIIVKITYDSDSIIDPVMMREAVILQALRDRYNDDLSNINVTELPAPERDKLEDAAKEKWDEKELIKILNDVFNEQTGHDMNNLAAVLASAITNRFAPPKNEWIKKDILPTLQRSLDDFEWTWDNMSKPHNSDHFNRPANGIEELKRCIELLTLSSPPETI